MGAEYVLEMAEGSLTIIRAPSDDKGKRPVPPNNYRESRMMTRPSQGPAVWDQVQNAERQRGGTTMKRGRGLPQPPVVPPGVARREANMSAYGEAWDGDDRNSYGGGLEMRSMASVAGDNPLHSPPALGRPPPPPRPGRALRHRAGRRQTSRSECLPRPALRLSE